MFLLFQPRANLLQLVGQVGQCRPHQLLLVFVSGPLANQLAMAGNSFHLIGDQTDFTLQFLKKINQSINSILQKLIKREKRNKPEGIL